jgi:hypothetical protein
VIGFTFLILALEAFIYPGYTMQNFGLNPDHIMVISLLIILLRSLKKPHQLLSKLLKLNQKYLFPLLTVLYFIFSILEMTQYTNFVFSRFHVHPAPFIYLPLFSGAVSFIFFKNLGKRKLFYSLFLPLTMFGFWRLLMTDYLTFVELVKEDAVFEYIQFFLFLISAIFAFKTYRHFKKTKAEKAKTIIFLILSLGFLFIALDEISWGQRILGIKSSTTIEEINAQDELTIHNLKLFQETILHPSYMLVGLYGAFAFLIVKYLLPKKYNYLTLYTPKPYLFFCFFSVFAYYFLFEFYIEPNQIQIGKAPMNSWQEVFETYMAFGFYGYILPTFRKLKS